ncbi:telomerase reverse transcriptase-like [Stegostoma tigrinum]|uniref:telomerase reverse transcriptase-like n=1 Tax=Stegostoma tigrinum TaxID=3053191 RepID=UPI0028703B09|nr:telomerase reverse transcriptase-like [Stegostoma tigrinum]
MVSFDVTALFTSININLAKETLTTLLEEPKTHTPDTTNLISKDNIIKLVDLCLTTHFTFNNKTYRQTNGTPMGSPISGFLAEAVMQRLEQTALPIIQPKLCVRYVDDTFVITKQNKLEETFKTIDNTLNWHNIHKRGGKQQQTANPRCHSRANSQWGTSNQRLQENNTYRPNTELQEQPSQHPQAKLH